MFTSPKHVPSHRRSTSSAAEDARLKPRTRRLIAAGIVTALVLGGGTAAFAYWTATGHGQGSATTGSTTPFTVSSTAATGTAMAPGGATDTVAFTVLNPGTGSEILSAVAVTVANQTDGSAWTAVTGCSAADYTLGVPAITYGQIAGGATLSGTVTITMNNRAANQNACQAVAVPIYFSVS